MSNKKGASSNINFDRSTDAPATKLVQKKKPKANKTSIEESMDKADKNIKKQQEVNESSLSKNEDSKSNIKNDTQRSKKKDIDKDKKSKNEDENNTIDENNNKKKKTKDKNDDDGNNADDENNNKKKKKTKDKNDDGNNADDENNNKKKKTKDKDKNNNKNEKNDNIDNNDDMLNKNDSNNNENTVAKKNVSFISPKLIDYSQDGSKYQINPKVMIKKNKKYKVVIEFKRQEYIFDLKPKSTIAEFRKMIGEKLYQDPDDLDIIFKEKVLENTEETNKQLVYNLVKEESFPLFDVKKKFKCNENNLSQIYLHNYNNKVIVNNVDDYQDLTKHIEQFFTDSLVQKDYLCEPIEMNKYSVGFPNPNLAFDFNRYLLILKTSNDNYKNIKSTLQMEKHNKATGLKNNRSMTKNENSKGVGRYKIRYNSKNNNKYNSALYAGLSGEYVTLEERRRREEIENKKKWIDDRGFIPYARGIDGLYNNKFIYY